MGWLWASSSAKPPTEATNTSTPTPPDTNKQVPTPNDVAADPEVQKFLELLLRGEASEPAPTSSSSSSSNSNSNSNSKSPPPSSSWLSLKASTTASEKAPDAPPRDPVSESLLPTEMSCRQAFDLAWACNSFGGQWNAVYRHGEMRSCSAQWDDFWFCMRNKSQPAPAKARAVTQHYRNKEHAKYFAPGMRSSEDVWEARQEKLPWGAAFSQSIGDPAVDDDEWRRQESERRRGIRDELGYSKASS